MANFYRDVVVLRAAGFELKRQGRGDHEIWWNPQSRLRVTVDRKLRSKITANEILKDAGVAESVLTVCGCELSIHLSYFILWHEIRHSIVERARKGA